MNDSHLKKATTQFAVESMGYSARIQRTSYDIPHITARDLPSAWFGQGYAMAEDRICTVLDQVIKVRSQRSHYFGPGESNSNINNDFAYKHLGLIAAAERDWNALPTNIRDMLTAHAAGINNYVSTVGVEGLPKPCRNVEWIVEVTPIDLFALAFDFELLLSSRFFIPFLGNAGPPVAGNTSETTTPPMLRQGKSPGSNGWGLGGDSTESGNGILLAQPHFPWEGDLQTWESHVTVPGQIDFYGVTIPGIPNTLLGFNAAIAWTLTVTTSPKAILYQLELVPDEPTKYSYDGGVRPMESSEYTIDVRNETGGIEKMSRTLWRSHYGPILSIPADNYFAGDNVDYSWNTRHVLTYRDANIDNRTFLSQFFDMSRSEGLDSFIEAHKRWAGSIPFSNTVATSAEGDAWYADSSPVPNISAESIKAWQETKSTNPGVATLYEQHGIYILDGSTSRDEWVVNPKARIPGFIPFSEAPQQRRRDYVFNANGSHWLTNPTSPLEGFNRLFGEERSLPSLRTRMNALELVKGSGQSKFSLAQVKKVSLSNHSLTAELIRTELVKRCTKTPVVIIESEPVDLSEACAVLSRWDESFDLDSEGAVLFRELLGSFGHSGHGVFTGKGLFAEPFDPEDPVLTPRGLAPSHGGENDPILVAIGQAVIRLARAGYTAAATLRELQFTVKRDRKIPIHGGLSNEGIMNIAGFGSNTTLLPGMTQGEEINPTTGLTNVGYVVNYGTSFLMAVELTPNGPKCQAILSFSQSTDTDSPYFSDQTELYSRKEWRPCLYTQNEIQADPVLRTYVVGDDSTNQ